MKKLPGQIQDFLSAPYTPKDLPAGNSFNKIYLDCIIADAISEGMLKDQALALRLPEADGDRVTYGIGGSESFRRVALALVAYYLQSRQYYPAPAPAFVPVVQLEVGNWINVRTIKNGTQLTVAYTIESATMDTKDEALLAHIAENKGDDRLFQHITLSNGKKFSVSQNWLDTYAVTLIDAAQADAYRQQGYHIFTDTHLIGG